MKNEELVPAGSYGGEEVYGLKVYVSALVVGS